MPKQQQKKPDNTGARLLGGAAGFLAPRALNGVAADVAMAPEPKHVLGDQDVHSVAKRMGFSAEEMPTVVDSSAMPKGNAAAIPMQDVPEVMKEKTRSQFGIPEHAKNTVIRPKAGQTSEAIVAHELGHLQNAKLLRRMGIAKQMMVARSVSGALQRAGGGILPAAGTAYALGSEDPSWKPALAYTAAASPVLVGEGMANARAAKHMVGRYGLKKGLSMSRKLAPAYGTYLALGATPLAATAARKAWKHHQEKTSQAKIASIAPHTVEFFEKIARGLSPEEEGMTPRQRYLHRGDASTLSQTIAHPVPGSRDFRPLRGYMQGEGKLVAPDAEERAAVANPQRMTREQVEAAGRQRRGIPHPEQPATANARGPGPTQQVPVHDVPSSQVHAAPPKPPPAAIGATTAHGEPRFPPAPPAAALGANTVQNAPAHVPTGVQKAPPAPHSSGAGWGAHNAPDWHIPVQPGQQLARPAPAAVTHAPGPTPAGARAVGHAAPHAARQAPRGGPKLLDEVAGTPTPHHVNWQEQARARAARATQATHPTPVPKPGMGLGTKALIGAGAVGAGALAFRHFHNREKTSAVLRTLALRRS